jgi:hypothetical protein
MTVFAHAMLLLPLQAGLLWMLCQPQCCQLLKGVLYMLCCLGLQGNSAQQRA